MRLAVLAAVAALAGCNMPYSEGVRSGVVQKISLTGLVCKTYEGELVMDGFKSRSKSVSSGNSTASTSAFGNVWAFSADDPDVVAQLEKASEAGYRVKLHYTKVFLKTPCYGHTGYKVDRVEKVAE